MSGLDRATTTDTSGNFTFANIPYNPYHLTVTAPGFTPRPGCRRAFAVPVVLKIGLTLGQATESVHGRGGGDLVETDSTSHTDIDRTLFQDVPLESSSSS